MVRHIPGSRVCVLAAMLLACAPIRAQEEIRAARVVVDATGTGTADEILTQLRDAFGDTFDAQVMGIEQAMDYGFGPWAITSPATLQQCSAEPLSVVELDEAIGEIESLMLALEYGDATARLAHLESRLCAASDPLPDVTAARVPFLLGICRYYAGDEDSARAAFLRAVERLPELQWDPDFPPAPQQVFQRSLSDAIRSPRTALQVDEVDRPLRLSVDGVAVDADCTSVPLVGPTHLLQLDRGDGQIVTLMLHTGEAERIKLLGPRQARAGLLESPQTEEGGLAFGRLVVAAHRLGYAEVLVQQTPRPELVWRYNDVERCWGKVSLVMGHQLALARRARTTGGVFMGFGAALALSGAAIGITSREHGQELFDEMQQDSGMYDLLIDEYEAHRRGTVAGFTVMGIGFALASAGIPFIAHGARVEKGALNDARLTVAPSPEGVYVGLTLIP